MMQILNQVKYLRAAIDSEKQAGRRIILVPTMGHLHRGHLQLVKHAHGLGDIVVVSIFVNPMQFSADEDLDNYPKTLAEDRDKLEAEGAHYLFTPDNTEIYPNGTETHTTVSVDALSKRLCGLHRPTHFQGVCTVVNKLFNLVQPDSAVFGEKDFQQLAVIRRMVSDLCLPIDIIGVPTVRDDNGLALSSRNSYLSAEQRQRAAGLQKTLQQTREKLLRGDRQYHRLCDTAINQLTDNGFAVDYFEICNAESLEKLADGDSCTQRIAIAAASLGPTRLIDNLCIDSL